MKERKAEVSRPTVWRLSKDGFVEAPATLLKGVMGAEIRYDNPLPEKDYSAKCDVCLLMERGYACVRDQQTVGFFEYEGGCMDCKHLCRKKPMHIGVRNFCSDHAHILDKKLGIVRGKENEATIS